MAWQTVFVDGFDHYATADLSAKWYAPYSAAISTSIFRTSGKAVRAPVTTSGGSLIKALPSTTPNFLVGFGYYQETAFTGAAATENYTLLLWLSNGPSPSAGGVALSIFADGKLRAYTGVANHGAFQNNLSSPALLGTGTTTLPLNTWLYVEVRVFVHNTAGVIEVRVNGAVEILVTGVDTLYASVSGVAGIGFLSPNNGGYFDDVYMRQSALATEETGGFYGDVKIKPYYPDADGTYAQMTPSTGTTHYTLVDEANPTTTDYVSSSTAGHKDSYSFQPVSETGSIKAVQLSVSAGKDDAGFRSIDLFTKSGATEDFAASQSLSTTVVYKSKLWENDPNTGSSWSQTNLNNAEFGVRISADV